MSQIGGYDSHADALKAFARFTKVERVIEFGAGKGSTHLFLNKQYFPDLISLTSFEHDVNWANTVMEGRGDESRLELIVTPAETFVEKSMGLKADLVFIDCIGSRELLFDHALTLAPVFAIHDRQEVEITGFKYVKGFNSHIQTVFVSNAVDLSGLKL